jgi:TRAP-type C4-dicarboxylate transport system permease small subunit
LQTVLRVIDSINKYLTYVVGVILAIMSIIILYQVVSRFLFSMPLPWSEETARFLMAYATFFGAALAIRKQNLIGVEAISERLSWKMRRILKTVVYLVSIFFFILLIVKGIEMMGKVSLQISPALQIPMSFPYAAIPIGAALLIMNSVAVIIEMYTQQREELD